MTILYRPTYKCDGCGLQAANGWRTLRFQHGWRMMAAKPYAKSKTRHYCGECAERVFT